MHLPSRPDVEKISKQEVSNIPGFNAFVRDFHPSFVEEMVLMGLNTPVRV